MWTLWPPMDSRRCRPPLGPEPRPGPGFLRRHPGLSAAALIVALLLTNLGPSSHAGHGPRDGAIPLISLAVVAPLALAQARADADVPDLVGGRGRSSGPSPGRCSSIWRCWSASTRSRRRPRAAARCSPRESWSSVSSSPWPATGRAATRSPRSCSPGSSSPPECSGSTSRCGRAYLAEVEARAARLEFERDQQGRLAVAAERNRIAREMHDIVAHNLSVMIALNDGASFTLHTDPERAAEAVREASSVGRTALGELRRALGGAARRRPGRRRRRGCPHSGARRSPTSTGCWSRSAGPVWTSR